MTVTFIFVKAIDSSLRDGNSLVLFLGFYALLFLKVKISWTPYFYLLNLCMSLSGSVCVCVRVHACVYGYLLPTSGHLRNMAWYSEVQSTRRFFQCQWELQVLITFGKIWLRVLFWNIWGEIPGIILVK